jgi:hypothetical protein
MLLLSHSLRALKEPNKTAPPPGAMLSKTSLKVISRNWPLPARAALWGGGGGGGNTRGCGAVGVV